ncbi:prolipoprotein diacylglyceryl transferase family protein [Desertibacillus haloalkaliphilus]|uniref:prolipoprotein diacylglyceryl transferase family protein n=1 Tax=Desertibacillus haloalkaliphilus TaxID=1328930 RepID=UPI001C26C2D4|nr:prolipoprotein diacylglyceryl transferase family protein [Desertibacillus haloalkaliphilus]MBU8908717.1 hypothetical protein [Desertibacillus haloalkaliphilus]
MGEYLELGQIRLPVQWVFIGLGLLIAYLVINSRVKKTDLNNKHVVDGLFNALFYGFIVWKLSYVLFYPIYAFTYPVGILYFDGGRRGVLLALLVGIVYIYRYARKRQIGLLPYSELIMAGGFAASAVYFIHVTVMNPLFYVGQIMLALGLLVVIYKEQQVGQVKTISNVALMYSLAQLFLHYFSQQPPLFLGLTAWQLIFAIVAVVIIILQQKGEGYEKA